MKLLVIGASRGIGLEVVKQALSRGYEVRAFARSAASIRLSNPRLEKRSGSALNVSDVASAMPGVDAVVLTLGVRAGPGMVLGPIHLFSKATQIVIGAMKKACVRRLICVTGFGAGDSRAKLGPLQGHVLRAPARPRLNERQGCPGNPCEAQRATILYLSLERDGAISFRSARRTQHRPKSEDIASHRRLCQKTPP